MSSSSSAKRPERARASRPNKVDDSIFDAKAIVYHDAAGIDIGSEAHYVSVPDDRSEPSVRTFGCFTTDIQAMAAWLKECSIRHVVMESTGVYWIPVFEILEARGLEVYLVNARHIKNVPGRKTDVSAAGDKEPAMGANTGDALGELSVLLLARPNGAVDLLVPLFGGRVPRV